MLENFLLALIVLGCAFFIGRRFYRQWRAASRPGQAFSCNCCSACPTTGCADRSTTDKDSKK